MRRVVKVRKVSMDWSIGLFTSAVVACIAYELLGEKFPWWLILICLAIVPIVDTMAHGTSTQEKITIEKDV